MIAGIAYGALVALCVSAFFVSEVVKKVYFAETSPSVFFVFQIAIAAAAFGLLTFLKPETGSPLIPSLIGLVAAFVLHEVWRDPLTRTLAARRDQSKEPS